MMTHATTSTRFRVLRLMLELCRYGFVSAVALAVDFGTLLLLAKYLHYLAAACISFTLGGVVAYWLSIKFVFAQRTIKHAGAELGLFIGLGVVGLGLNALIISLAMSQWHLPLGFSKMLAAVGTFTCNFALRKWLLFSRHHTNRSATDALSTQ